MKKMLIQTQLSSYNREGKFDLATDSGWQMTLGRARMMLSLNSELCIDVMCPRYESCIISSIRLNKDLYNSGRLKFIEHEIIPNALATRFDFDYRTITHMINFYQKRSGNYDVVLINDPMHLRNFKAVFNELKHRPLFVTHSHFIDNPQCPKFPNESSLWMGQVEAARRSDLNFWQCESALNIFHDEMINEYRDDVVNGVMKKSFAWDDGYSSEEINFPIDHSKIRFNVDDIAEKMGDKIVLFVPNRIGDGVRSNDYTNCGKFMREFLPKLRKHRDDFIVICGNPNQKITNEELETTSGQHGYINVLKGVTGSGSFNRDEYKWIADASNIVVALFNQDSYGGTASRECIERGCYPLWLDNYEYRTISKLAMWPDRFVAKCDMSDLVERTNDLITNVKNNHAMFERYKRLRDVVRERCSYENTTKEAIRLMNEFQINERHRSRVVNSCS